MRTAAMIKAVVGIAVAVWGLSLGFIVGYGTIYASIITPQTVENFIDDVKKLNFTEQIKREDFLNTMLKDSPRPVVGVVAEIATKQRED